MTDIFISYSRNDRERVRFMAQALEADGFKVWWDPEILPGESFSKVIDNKLKDSSCIIAVWSKSSINSNWVQEEADDGMMRNTLIPVMIDEIDLPRGFKRLQTADLRGWEGDVDDPNWQMILTQVRKLVSNRAAAEAAERQAAAQAREKAKQKPQAPRPAAAAPVAAPSRPAAAAPPQAASAPAPEKKSGGLPILPIAAALAFVGIGIFGYLLLSGGDDDPSSDVIANNDVPAAEPAPIVASAIADPIVPEQEPADETPASNETLESQSPIGEDAGSVDPTAVDPDAINIDGEDTLDALDSEAADGETGLLDVADVATDEVESAPSFTPGEAFRDCEMCPEVMPFEAGGVFTMGAPDGEFGRDEAETPQVDITIAKPFAIGVYEVTYDDWAACIADGGCGGYTPSDLGWGKGRRPLINVSVEDAKQYLAWLSEETGTTYRLPSEAEWEYAARAGKAEPFHTGGLITADQANFNGQYPYNNAPKGVYRSRTTTVGSFAANDFGLYDLHGNVWEWTEDCWRSSHSGVPENGEPVGGSCSSRVLKGGAWNAGAWRLRSAFRKAGENSLRKFDTGFRVARDL